MRGASRCLLVAFPGCFPSVLPLRALSWAAWGRRWASLCPAAARPEPPFLPGRPHRDVELQGEGLRAPLAPWEAAAELGCFPSICPGVGSRLQLAGGMRSQGTHGCHQPTNAPYPCPCFGTWRGFPRIWAAPPAPECCWLGSRQLGPVRPLSLLADPPAVPVSAAPLSHPNKQKRTGRSTQPRFAGKGWALCLFSLFLLF